MPAKCRYACRSILTGLEARRRIEIDRSSVSAPDRHARDFRRVRIELESELSGATFHAGRSDAVLQEMWEKWVFIAAPVGITCLMRATTGDIVAAQASDLATALLDECAAIAAQQGCAPCADSMRGSGKILTAAGSAMTASMFPDIERGAPVEAERILGDLPRRAGKPAGERSMLCIASAHLQPYQKHRLREIRGGKGA